MYIGAAAEVFTKDCKQKICTGGSTEAQLRAHNVTENGGQAIDLFGGGTEEGEGGGRSLRCVCVCILDKNGRHNSVYTVGGIGPDTVGQNHLQEADPTK
jgi:hypothetical protein